MQVQSEDKPYDDINITPMLDLAYVLLVIFILMCTASVAGTKVNLPKASNTPHDSITAGTSGLGEARIAPGPELSLNCPDWSPRTPMVTGG